MHPNKLEKFTETKMKQKTFTLASNKYCKGNVFVVLSITTSYDLHC